MPKYKIAIGFPTGDRLVHQCVPISLVDMLSERDWTDYRFTVLPETSMYIAVNRNKIVREFLKTDCDFLYFWDSDNGIYPDAFDIFMEDMQQPDVHIVSGMYHRKEPLLRTCLGISFPGMGEDYTCETAMFVNSGLVNLSTVVGSVRGMVGTGALMIRREVLEAIPKPQFENLFYLGPEYQGERRLGHKTEDVDFCEKAQAHGYHIYVDTRIRSPHYQGEDCFPESWKQWEESKNDVVEFACDKLTMPEGAMSIALKDFQD
jgi:GT2 family glycosyltransferase